MKTSAVRIEINKPRDRLGSFAPDIIKKRKNIMAASLEDKFIGLYGLGTILRDISAYIKKTYNTHISDISLSNITEKVIPTEE